MNQRIETMLEKTPKCLARFTTAPATISLPNQQLDDVRSVVRAIKCACSNDELFLETARRKELKGVCRQDEIITAIPPVYVGCQSCGRLTLLFDPLIHGWSGEMSEPEDSEDVLRLMKLTPRVGRIYVTCAYENDEKYAELAKTGIENLQDYFDKFTIFFCERADGNMREVLSSNCA